MVYRHWSSRPVRLTGRTYPQSGHPKPNGFWFDVDDSWKEWCEAARFRPERLRFFHEVTLLDLSRVLFLKTAEDIDRFTREYGHDLSAHIEPLQGPEARREFADRYGCDLFGDIRRHFSSYILWGEVAKRHAGIVIHPYIPERSATYLWYAGWNCAGGCVWDLAVMGLGRARPAPPGFGRILPGSGI